MLDVGSGLLKYSYMINFSCGKMEGKSSKDTLEKVVLDSLLGEQCLPTKTPHLGILY